MAKTQILEYTIYLRDAATVAAYQAQLAAGTGPGHLLALPTGGFGVYRAPTGAAIEFGTAAGGSSNLPFVEVGQPAPAGGAGYITSGWFTGPTGFPRNVATFTHDGGWWFFGTDTKFYWSGKFALAPGAPVTVGTPVQDLPLQSMSTRYWLHGFEMPMDGDEGGISGSGQPQMQRRCLAASRTGDGVGARFGSGNTAGAYVQFTPSNLRPVPVVAITNLWERFYVRPMRYGSATRSFHAVYDNRTSGFEIAITPTGQWALYAVPNTSVSVPRTLIVAFGQAQLGVWTRFDVLTNCAGLTIKVRVNGVQLASGIVTPALLFPPYAWGSSSLGLGLFSADSGLIDTELDFDDWVGGTIPVTQSSAVPTWSSIVAYAIGAVVTLTAGNPDGQVYVATAASTNTPPASHPDVWALAAAPSDFRQGSHLVRIPPEAFGPAHNPAWVGDVRGLGQRGHYQGITYADITTTTPLAIAEVEVPLATRANHPQSLGIAAWRVMAFTRRETPGTLPGSLGYQVGAAAPVVTPMTGEGQTFSYEAMTGQPTTGDLLPLTETLRLRYVKANESNVARVSGLSVLVELSGIFGPEDGAGVDPAAYPVPVPVHMHPWPRTSWATEVLPSAPVIVVGGTYTGNGTGQDLLFKFPPTLLLIRPVSVFPHQVVRWWPSALWAHGTNETDLAHATQIAVVDTDDSFVPASPDDAQQMQFRARLGTTSLDTVNAVGVVYQYVALLDPAARFTRAFATSARPVGTTPIPGVPRTWPLDDLTFVPEVGYAMNESTLGAGGTAPEVVWKTPGHAAAAANDLNTGTAIASGWTFGTGQVTIGPGLVADSIEQTAQLLIRRHDGNDYPNGPPVVFYGTYTGDGAASRTITIGTLGRRPLYAHVGGVANNVQYHRDPSHLTTTSSQVLSTTSAAVTGAITGGGIDTFTVGVTLNANGVVYGYFGLYGGTDPGNGGWSTNGEFVLPADSRKPPGWVEPGPVDPDDPGPGGPGEPEPPPPDGYPEDPGDPGSDIFADCVKASTRIVNLALQEIGITKQITSLGATTDDPPVWIDQSQEAYAARLIYRTMVDTVLRDDDWAFTREYATLTATAGSVAVPVNPDWTYTYTLPIDCLRVKRICVPETQRRYSTEPVAFDRRSASLGYVDVLLTNEPGGGLLPEPAVGAPRTVTIEYAKRISCAARVSDAQFRECLVFRLAAGLAKALSRDAADADRCLRNYAMVRPRALVNQANDQEPQRPTRGLPDWTTGR